MKLRARVCRNILALCLALATVAQAHAFSLDTGPGAAVGGGWSLYDDRPVTQGYQALAGYFTVDTAATITSVQAWMNWEFGGRLRFSITTDFFGLPGANLYGAAVLLPVTASNTPDWRGVGGLDWALAQGNYWLVIEDVPGGGSGALPAGAGTPLANYASSPGLGGSGWMQASTLNFGVRINVFPEPPPASTTVPLPPAGLLLGAGLIVLHRRTRGAWARMILALQWDWRAV